MTRNAIISALAAVLLGTLALAGCGKDGPAPPAPAATPASASAVTPVAAPASAPPPAPIVVTSVDLGSAIDADHRVLRPATLFATTDTLHASVAMTLSDPSLPRTGRLTARWTFDGGQLVDETRRDFTFTGPATLAFRVDNPDGWPAGSYRLEILLDGELVQTRDFEVR